MTAITPGLRKTHSAVPAHGHGLQLAHVEPQSGFLQKNLGPVAGGVIGAVLGAGMLKGSPLRTVMGALAGAALGVGAAKALGSRVGGGGTAEYVVSLSTAPDFSKVQGDPAGVYRVANEHFAKQSPPIVATLERLKGEEVIDDFYGSALANNFVVTVRSGKYDQFHEALHATTNVGDVEKGM